MDQSLEGIVVEARSEIESIGDAFEHKTVPGLTSIILPVFNNSYAMMHVCGNAIGSIREHTKLPYELIIVDNGSLGGYKPQKMADWKADKIVTNDTNLGYVKAVNKGIRASFGEYIAILTSDIQVYDNWLEDAQEALKHVALVYAKPMYGEVYARAKEAEAKRAKWADKPIEESLNNDLEDGSCLVTTKKLFDTIGLFDERYFNYAADRDLFREIEKVGLKYAGCERINIHHIIQGTGSGLEGNPEIMDKDKEEYKKKWEGGEKMEPQQQTPTVESTIPEPEKPYEITFDKKFFTEEDIKTVTDFIDKLLQAKPQPQATNPNLIRTADTGDKIYLKVGNELHWIMNAETLKELGFDFGQETFLSKEEFVKYERSEPINLTNVAKYKNA